jgi:hypothetical protein
MRDDCYDLWVHIRGKTHIDEPFFALAPVSTAFLGFCLSLCRASSTGVLVFGFAAGFLLVRFLSPSLLSLSFLSWGLGNGFACCSMQFFLTSLLS